MIAGRAEPGWRVRIGFFAVPLAAFALYAAATRAPEPGHRVIASFGGRTFDLAVADTGKLRERGLQGHPEPGRGHGMLFVFDEPQQVTIAMKTVPYRIDVAFIDSSLRVVRTVAMQPEPLGIQRAVSGVPVRYVVEARAGTVLSDELTVGSRFRMLQEVP
ncbi:MAG TPA: DUF192 domain-containing protein [Coriobacteriia bacterium]|jgi:hypothetical protein